MDNFTKLQTAAARFGKRGLAKRINISEAALYLALREHRGLRPDYMESIDALLQSSSKSTEMPGNAPGVAIEPTQGQISSDAGLLRLLYQELPKLSETNLAKVYRYVIELQIKQESE